MGVHLNNDRSLINHECKVKFNIVYFYPDIEEKEDKMQHLYKQIEQKNVEVQRYKTAADVAKV